MQTSLVALILAAVVGAVFLIARRGYWGYPQRVSDEARGSGETAIAKFFALFWGKSREPLFYRRKRPVTGSWARSGPQIVRRLQCIKLNRLAPSFHRRLVQLLTV